MSDTNDPMEPINRLLRRLAEVTDPLGLKIRTTRIAPDIDGSGKPHLEALFSIDVEQLGKDPEQVRVDYEFENLAANFNRPAREKAENGLDELLSMRERLAGGGPLLPGTNEENTDGR